MRSIKKEKIKNWIYKFRGASGDTVLVNEFCYSCLFSGEHKTKTLIVIPEKLDKNGILSIDKSLERVEIIDVIRLYTKIKSTLS